MSPAQSLTDWFRRRTAPTIGTADRFAELPKPARIAGIVILIAAFYMMPFWPDVPLLGWIIDTPGTSFSNVLTDQILVFVLVAIGLNVVVGLAGLLDLGYVGFYAGVFAPTA